MANVIRDGPQSAVSLALDSGPGQRGLTDVGQLLSQYGSALYVVGAGASPTLAEAMTYKSSDGGATWAEVDGANRPTTAGNNGVSQSRAALRGSTVHLIQQTISDSKFYYHTFNLATDAWSIKSEATGLTLTTTAALLMFARSDGAPVCVYTGQTERIMGTSFNRVCFMYRTGGVWTLNVYCDGHATGEQNNFGAHLCGCLDDADRIHVECNRGSSPSAAVTTTIRANWTVSAQTVLGTANALGSTYQAFVQNGLAILWYGSPTGYVSATPADSPTWSSPVQFAPTGVDGLAALLYEGVNWNFAGPSTGNLRISRNMQPHAAADTVTNYANNLAAVGFYTYGGSTYLGIPINGLGTPPGTDWYFSSYQLVGYPPLLNPAKFRRKRRYC